MIALAASVVSCSDSGTDPEPGDTDEFVKNYIEALFLGTGPLIPQDNFTACVTNRGQWAGFPRGTAVRVVASSTLDLGSDGVDTKQLIEAALATVTEATLGEIQISFTITNDPDPMPGLNEATGTDHPSPQDTGCAFDRGCVHIQFTEAGSGIMISSRATLREGLNNPIAIGCGSKIRLRRPIGAMKWAGAPDKRSEPSGSRFDVSGSRPRAAHGPWAPR